MTSATWLGMRVKRGILEHLLSCARRTRSQQGFLIACSLRLQQRCRPADRRLNAVVSHAAAEHTFHAFANLGVGRVGVLIEQRLGSHDLAVLAEAALWRLLIDP